MGTVVETECGTGKRIEKEEKQIEGRSRTNRKVNEKSVSVANSRNEIILEEFR